MNSIIHGPKMYRHDLHLGRRLLLCAVLALASAGCVEHDRRAGSASESTYRVVPDIHLFPDIGADGHDAGVDTISDPDASSDLVFVDLNVDLSIDAAFDPDAISFLSHTLYEESLTTSGETIVGVAQSGTGAAYVLIDEGAGTVTKRFRIEALTWATKTQPPGWPKNIADDIASGWNHVTGFSVDAANQTLWIAATVPLSPTGTKGEVFAFSLVDLKPIASIDSTVLPDSEIGDLVVANGLLFVHSMVYNKIHRFDAKTLQAGPTWILPKMQASQPSDVILTADQNRFVAVHSGGVIESGIDGTGAMTKRLFTLVAPVEPLYFDLQWNRTWYKKTALSTGTWPTDIQWQSYGNTSGEMTHAGAPVESDQVQALTFINNSVNFAIFDSCGRVLFFKYCEGNLCPPGASLPACSQSPPLDAGVPDASIDSFNDI